MTAITDIQRAITWIEQHLTNKITIEQIAQQAYCSPFHFQRLFTLLTGTTVADYIRKRRCTKAAEWLVSTEWSVLDIATRLQYESPEAFTKAFKRQHHMTPTQARIKGQALVMYHPLQIEVRLKGVEPMKVRVEEHPAFQVLGQGKQFDSNEGIPAFWDDSNANGLTDQLVQLNNGPVTGVLGICYPEQQTMTYVIGASITAQEQTNLTTFEVPAATWAIFEVIGPMPTAMQEGWSRIYQEWLPSSSYETTGGPEFELYTEDDPFSADCYSEIWLPVRKKA